MPPIADNSTTPDRDDDGESSNAWEAKFLAARPTLPLAAMQRIESAIDREIARQPARREDRRSLWIVVIIMAVAVGLGAAPLIHWLREAREKTSTAASAAAPIRNLIPLEVAIGPVAADAAGESRIDPSAPRIAPQAIIQATSVSVEEGVTTYRGAVTIWAGAWQITCDRLTVFRGAGHIALLTGKGNIRLTGVPGVDAATADEMTLNTETGETKLSGRVHLLQAPRTRDLPVCVITRTGEVQAQKP